MTLQEEIAALPEMPDIWAGNDEMTLDEVRKLRAKALEARLALAVRLLEENHWHILIQEDYDNIDAALPRLREGIT